MQCDDNSAEAGFGPIKDLCRTAGMPSEGLGLDIQRRDFITLLGGIAATLPIVAKAQTSAKIPRVGYISPSSATATTHLVDAFRQGLGELGYVDGATIALDIRYGDGRSERIRELAVELASLKIDVLVAGNSIAAVTAKNATASIPIVAVTADPVGLGLVASLARPGGNVTGLSYFNEAIIGKRVQILKEFMPELVRLAVFRNSAVEIHGTFWQDLEVAARALGVALQPLEVREPEDFDPAFAAALQRNAQALITFDDALTNTHRRRLVALAASNKLPAIYGLREFPDDGGLMSYGASFVHLFRRAATFVDKIIKGAKPADLPVEQPTKLELVINRKAANALGLTVPATLLAQADDVIE